MSEADKFFSDAGYPNKVENEYFILYFDEYEIGFDFDLKEKTVTKGNGTYEMELPITMQELKAINMKCKELGWIE